MNRMIRLFQQKSNQAFDRYLEAKKKCTAAAIAPSLADPNCPVCSGKGFPGHVCNDWTGSNYAAQNKVAMLRIESDLWAKAAELLRKEEANKT